jgi:hypothetical protein
MVEYGGHRGFPLVPWDVHTIPKDEGGGLVNVAIEGSVLEAKWVVQCLKGLSPW